MGDRRHYGPEEYRKIEGAPLPPARLAAIWYMLPEQERLSFVLSLDETIADAVIAATVKYTPAQPAERKV